VRIKRDYVRKTTIENNTCHVYLWVVDLSTSSRLGFGTVPTELHFCFGFHFISINGVVWLLITSSGVFKLVSIDKHLDDTGHRTLGIENAIYEPETTPFIEIKWKPKQKCNSVGTVPKPKREIVERSVSSKCLSLEKSLKTPEEVIRSRKL
jgi:hypothetical protein